MSPGEVGKILWYHTVQHVLASAVVITVKLWDPRALLAVDKELSQASRPTRRANCSRPQTAPVPSMGEEAICVAEGRRVPKGTRVIWMGV